MFLSALHDVLNSVPLAHNAIAKRAGVNQSSLSCYNTGRRVPDPGLLERIYKVLEGEVRRRGTKELPHTLSYLLQLRDAARAQPFAPSAANAALAASAATLPVRRSASPTFRDRRRVKRRRLARRKIAGLSAQAKVPVPRSTGDRHPAGNAHAADIAAYRGHMAAGRYRDAQFIAWALGNNLAPREFPHAVASYREAGAGDGAEAMLSAAASRGDVQASINITAALVDEGQVADAQAILTVIRTDQ
ncbi:helix-turn-helix domain-containing protein [Streptomyces formicae]